MTTDNAKMPMNETELRLVESLYADSDNGGTETVLRLLATVRDREARLRRAVEACRSFSRAFESGWPAHVTGSIGGLGHLPDQLCAACVLAGVYDTAKAVLTENADLLKGEST